MVICLERGADCLRMVMVQLMPLHPETPLSLALFKSRLVLLFWYRFTQVVLEKRPFMGVVVVVIAAANYYTSTSTTSTSTSSYYITGYLLQYAGLYVWRLTDLNVTVHMFHAYNLSLLCVVCFLFYRIADDILRSCVDDVVKEIEQINSDIVDHIYNAEFSVAQ